MGGFFSFLSFLEFSEELGISNVSFVILIVYLVLGKPGILKIKPSIIFSIGIKFFPVLLSLQ